MRIATSPRMLKVSIWMKTLCLLIVASLTFSALAAGERMGVLLPEQQQRQRAVKAAPAGQDEPLKEPAPAPEPEKAAAPAVEVPSEIQKKAEESLSTVTLEEKIQQQSIKGEIKQYGYDIFSAPPSSFAPIENVPVPPDYVIGPGETFVVQIYGPTDVEYRLVVTREGRLLVPEVGALQVAGMTFEDAKMTISKAVSALRIGVKTVITLADLHTIQVILVGDVEKPGNYTVSGLSSLLNTLITTGGVKRTGSLRNIQVRRGNQTVTRMDLYDVLLKGQSDSNIFLRHGDVIFVPPIGPTVGVAGEVNRPAIYEIKNEQTVDDVLALAGGVMSTASRDKPQIKRVTEKGGYTLVQADLTRQGGKLRIKNGDLIRVFPVLNKVDDVVLLSGNVLTPGGFQWRSGMRVSDLIGSPEQLRQKTEWDVAAILREVSSTRRVEIIYFDLRGAMFEPQSASNLLLRPRDQVIVFDISTGRDNQLADIVRQFKTQATAREPALIVDLKGYAKNPGLYPFQLGARWLDLIRINGGLQVGTDARYALMVRRDPQTGRIEFTQLSLQQAQFDPVGDHNPFLSPGDRFYLFDSSIDRAELIKPDTEALRKQTRYGELTPLVEVSGKVIRPGVYPLVPGMRVRDLVDAAGGMMEEAYGQSASLSRQVALSGEFQRTDQFDVSLMTTHPLLSDMDTVLQPYDHLTLRIKPEWIKKPLTVTVTGEVRYPGTYTVDKRETLCGLMQRVGGMTQDAYVFGTVFLRESVRKREQDGIDRLFNQMDNLLAEVHTSPTYDNDKKLPVNTQTYDIYKVIKALKPEKAVGRMVIDMAAAVEQCDEKADVVLEDGDNIHVPKFTDEVSVVGQVYFPTSHKFRPERAALDYINLSGGTKELAMREHAYIVQANGEVMSVRSMMSTWGWLLPPTNVAVTPGSIIFVPMSVDRINGREFAQSWGDLIYKLAISAASLAFLFK